MITKNNTDAFDTKIRNAFHFIGIGGAGMSVVAELLAKQGYRISGSDQKESDNLVRLRSCGIDARSVHARENVPSDAIVVVSSAIRNTNVELAYARSRSQTVIHRSQALAIAAQGMRFVAVAGAHGKTTTSGMLMMALRAAGVDPSAAVGGNIIGIGSGAYLGTGDIFVAEADESDESFLNYSPLVELVTNVEPDHLDHYGSREAFEQIFIEFSDRLSSGGLLICCAEDEGASRLARQAALSHRVLTYGRPEHCLLPPDLSISSLVVASNSASAVITDTENQSYTISLSVSGEHNILNAAGAWIAGVELGIEPSKMAQSLAAFHGASRRFELRGLVGTKRVFDDYAHHPSEVAATLAQARTVAGAGMVTVVFQPHLFSRTRNFSSEFAAALALADNVVLTDIYPAREDPIEGVDSSLIADRIPGAYLVHDMHEAARFAAELTGENGILITMGAGSITSTGIDVLAAWTENEKSGL